MPDNAKWKNSVIFVFALVLFAGEALYSKDFYNHVKDAYECFDYDNADDIAKCNFDAIVRFFYQEAIDQGHGNGSLITKIREGFRQYVPDFTTGNYSHRMVFHNGFKSGAEFSELPLAMRIQLDKADHKWKRKYRQQILKVFRNVQTEFYQKVQNRFRSEYGAMIMDDEQRKALIKILYYIHILGDYEESANEYTQGCLMDYFEMEEDLCKSLRDLRCGKTSSIEWNIKHTYSFDNSQRAKHVLDVLKEELPRLIKRNQELREALLGK